MEKKKKNGNGNGNHWTVEEVEILKKMKEEGEKFEAIAKNLKKLGFHRSSDSVKHKYQDLRANGYKNGDGKKKTWSTEEEIDLEEFIRTNTHMEDREEIYNHFPNRTKNSIRSKIGHLQKKLVNELSQQKEHDKKLEEKRKFEEEIIRLLIGEGGKKPKKPRTKLKL